MLDASTVFRCARVCSKYWSDATHPHTLDATPLSRHATLPQVPTYGVHERSEHGGLERVQRTFRTGCVRCSRQLRLLSRSRGSCIFACHENLGWLVPAGTTCDWARGLDDVFLSDATRTSARFSLDLSTAASIPTGSRCERQAPSDS